MAKRLFCTLVKKYQTAMCIVPARTITSQQLEYAEYGDPLNVIQLVNRELPDMGDDQLRYKVLASPINPADINTIEGSYPVKSPLPAVSGMEGVVRVEEVGKRVTAFQVGDLAIPCLPAIGLWRTAGLANPNDLIKVPKELDIPAAAMLTINPPTAYRMLKDFVSLQAGDTVLQNGANSAVGQLVIQLCKLFNLTTVNIIRDEKLDEQQTKNKLAELGANHVLTESEFKRNLKKLFNSTPAPKLALNCVSGRGTMYMMSCLAPNGVLVTYGGMSKKPLELPTGPFIFKQIVSRGFWVNGWNSIPSNHAERLRSTAQLASWFIEGKLRVAQHEVFAIDDYRPALEKQLAGIGKKKIFLLQ